MKSIDLPMLQMMKWKAVKMHCTPFIRIDYLYLRTWLGIVDNPSVVVLLRTSFRDRFIKGIFTSERKVVLCHSRPFDIILKFPTINTIQADTTTIIVNTPLKTNEKRKEHSLCCIGRQVTIMAYANATELVSSQSAAPNMVQNSRNVVESQRSMTSRGFMKILPG